MDLGLLKKKVIVTGGRRVKSWNRFDWQCLPINRENGKWLQCLAFVVRGVLSIFMTPFEISGSKGSADVCAYIS